MNVVGFSTGAARFGITFIRSLLTLCYHTTRITEINPADALRYGYGGANAKAGPHLRHEPAAFMMKDWL